MKQETLDLAQKIQDQMDSLTQHMSNWNTMVSAQDDFSSELKVSVINLITSHYQTKIGSLKSQFDSL